MYGGYQSTKQNLDPVYSQIIDYVTKGDGSGKAYKNLATFVDRFGSRKVGTQRLEDAISHLVSELESLGSLKVHTESFSFEGWQRGAESAELVAPLSKRLPMLSLGSSVGTAAASDSADGSIEADCVVVESFNELDRLGKAGISGKIVVYNQLYKGYGVSVQYRTDGASRASKYGAVAALIRSVTPFSIGSPHTGMQEYEPGLPVQIPACCITVEDAELMHRIYKRGDKVRVRLRMSCGSAGVQESRNIVADLEGSEKPQELVVVCGHIDSWDVGQGAMDDGGGAFCAMQSVRTLLEMGLRPRRTIRLVLFSGEEFGILGGNAYYERHKAELADKISFMLESDSGTFGPIGTTCSGSEATRSAYQQVLNLLEPIGATTLVPSTDGPDITVWAKSGVPVGDLLTKRAGQPDDFYFYFHHSEGDMMTVQDPAEMDRCVAAFAVVSLALADAAELLPRGISGASAGEDGLLSDWVLV
ncbi:hypothetical protein BOX15_Mlig013729g1 [Macrostomum lignano]|uniref:Carboxypeptidase Q n=2 Tax=Macrostomum lignano TaxID=282301 RepID=A0A267E843_9PLAT|nr:hypothetical protein BOX15_Mlig013729g1 [Macrostomum lignano]